MSKLDDIKLNLERIRSFSVVSDAAIDNALAFVAARPYDGYKVEYGRDDLRIEFEAFGQGADWDMTVQFHNDGSVEFFGGVISDDPADDASVWEEFHAVNDDFFSHLDGVVRLK